MDAKTLRAALAAALRVTVSTSLIGCGGQTSTDAGKTAEPYDPQATPASQPDDDYSNQAEPRGGSASSKPDYPAPIAQGGAASSPAASGSASGGSAAGSTSAGGMRASAGANSQSDAGAGTTPPTCETVAVCVSMLERLQIDFRDSLPAHAKECCATVVEALSGPRDTTAEVCDGSLDSRFMSAPAHAACCIAVDGWQQQACTPWGPAVPPELSLEALAAWELAA